MITLLNAPDQLCLTGNPQAYLLETDQGAGTPITFRLFIAPSYGQTPVQVIETRKPADADGRATFYVHDILRQNLSYELPEPGTTDINFLAQTCKRFYGQYSDNNSTFASDSTWRYALRGAWNHREFPFRSGHLPGGVLALSNRPFRRRIRYGQPEYVYWLYPRLEIPDELDDQFLFLDVTFTDGTIQRVQQNYDELLFPYNILVFAVGDDVRSYRNLDQTKTVSSVAVRFQYRDFNTGQLVLLDLCELEFYEPNSPYVRQFYYFNSLGGMDSLITTGEGEQELQEVEGEVTAAFLPYNYSISDAALVQGDPTSQTSVKLRLGYRSRRDYETALNMFSTKRVFEYVDGRLLAIIINNKKTKQYRDGEYQYSFEIEYQYAFYEAAI